MSVFAAADPWPSVDVEGSPWAVARRPGPWPEPVHSGKLGGQPVGGQYMYKTRIERSLILQK